MTGILIGVDEREEAGRRSQRLGFPGASQPTELRHLRGPLLLLLLILLRIVVLVLVRPLLLRPQLLLLRRRRLVLSRSVLLRDQLERLCIW